VTEALGSSLRQPPDGVRGGALGGVLEAAENAREPQVGRAAVTSRGCRCCAMFARAAMTNGFVIRHSVKASSRDAHLAAPSNGSLTAAGAKASAFHNAVMSARGASMPPAKVQ
jgi:hypothetical protein